MHLHEEVLHTDAYALQTPTIDQALSHLSQEFPSTFIPERQLADALSKAPNRVSKRNSIYEKTVSFLAPVSNPIEYSPHRYLPFSRLDCAQIHM